MRRRGQREFLETQTTALEELIRSLPEDAVLERFGFERRLAEVRELYMSEGDSAANFAHTRLVFGGDPVSGTDGIEARFAAEALGAYQDLVSKAVAAQWNLNPSGPVPFERQSRLHITDIARGSFGFELDEVQDQDSFAPTPLRDAVEHVARLISASASSDDEFVDAMAEVNPRVQDSLRKFIETVFKANATLGLTTWDIDVMFDWQTVVLAHERASVAWMEAAEVNVPGVFQGILHVSRSFEHRARDGELIKGKAGPDADLAILDKWIVKECTARLRRVSWQRTGKAFVRYTLLGIDPI